jgi:hypothetical protein
MPVAWGRSRPGPQIAGRRRSICCRCAPALNGTTAFPSDGDGDGPGMGIHISNRVFSQSCSRIRVRPNPGPAAFRTRAFQWHGDLDGDLPIRSLGEVVQGRSPTSPLPDQRRRAVRLGPAAAIAVAVRVLGASGAASTPPRRMSPKRSTKIAEWTWLVSITTCQFVAPCAEMSFLRSPRNA